MRRHGFDPLSFVLGALFMAVGLTFLFGDADIGDLHLSVVWPIPLIVVGLLMLVTAAQRRNRQAEADASPGEEPPGVRGDAPSGERTDPEEPE